MFLVFIPQYIPTFTNWDLQGKLQQHCSLTTEFGSVLKQYNLTNLRKIYQTFCLVSFAYKACNDVRFTKQNLYKYIYQISYLR